MANIPQAGYLGTRTQTQEGAANRRTSLLQGMSQMFMENRKLSEEKRQFDTDKLVDTAMSVLDSQYGGDWKVAVDNDDPTIKNLFGTLYGDEGMQMFEQLKAEGGMGQTPQQKTTQGANYRLDNLQDFQGQEQPAQGGNQQAPAGGARSQFVNYVQDLGKQTQVQGEQKEQALPPEEVEKPIFDLTAIPEELLKGVARDPDVASLSDVIRKKPMSGYTEKEKVEFAGVLRDLVAAVGDPVEDPQITKDSNWRPKRTQPGQTLDRELTPLETWQDKQFFSGYSTLSDEEREVVAQLFEKTGQIPKDVEAVKQIMGIQNIKETTAAIKNVADNPEASPEEVANAAATITQSEESFVKAAILDPESINAILTKYDSLTPPEFKGFVKTLNLPNETENAIIKAAAESYSALTPKEQRLYTKATTAALKSFNDADRPGQAGNPHLKKTLSSSQKVYANIATELGKGLQGMDPAVLASLSPNQRAGFQLKEAGRQFDKQLALQEKSQAAGIAMDWLKYRAAKDSIENPKASLTKETVDLMKVLQADVSKDLEMLRESSEGDPEKYSESVNKLRLSNAGFKTNYDNYIKFVASVTGESASTAQEIVTEGKWFWKSQQSVDYSVLGGGVTPTVTVQNENNNNTIPTLADDYK